MNELQKGLETLFYMARESDPATMAKSLDVSAHSIRRAMGNVYDYNGTDITRERYEQGRLLPSDRKFYYPGENFYMFSLRKYCGLTECPEWCEEFVKGDTKTEEPEQKEAPKNSTQIEESIQKEEEVSIPVKINKDGRNLTLTINIDLSF